MGGKTQTYVVQSGDWLAKIAEEHNSTVSAIWGHPKNAVLRAQRDSPNTLYPGDILHIPVEPEPPPSPAPPNVTPPPEPPWPYDYDKTWSSYPTWECPERLCHCDGHQEDQRREHTITFHQLDGHRFPYARVRVYERGTLITSEPTKTDSSGRLTVELRAATKTLFLEWAPSDVPLSRGLPYRKIYHVREDHSASPSHSSTRLRFANLGFQECRTHRQNLEAYKRAYLMPARTTSHVAEEDARRHHDTGTLPPFPRGPSTVALAVHESPDGPMGGPSPGTLPTQNQPSATPQQSGSVLPDSTHITVGVTAGGIRGHNFKCAKLRLILDSITTPSSHPTFVPKINTLLERNLENRTDHGANFAFYDLPHGVYTAVASVKVTVGGRDVWYSDTLRISTADGNPSGSAPPNITQGGRGWIFRNMPLTEHRLSVSGKSTAFSGETVVFRAGTSIGPIEWSIAPTALGTITPINAPLHRAAEYKAGSVGTDSIVVTDPCGQTADTSFIVTKKIVVVERLVIVVGTEHIYNSYPKKRGNKLVFMAQAVRACREYRRRFGETTVFVFEGGYEAAWLNRMEKRVGHYGGTFRKVSQWNDVVTDVNNFVTTTPDVQTFRRVHTMMIFGHGYPLRMALNGTSGGVWFPEFRRLDHRAFHSRTPSGGTKGPDAQISSWACQTANSGIDASESKNLEGSLARGMADHFGSQGTDVDVFAFGRKTNYGPTWNDSAFGTEEELSGGVLWQDEGADNPVVAGSDSDNGKMSANMWRFRYGAKAVTGRPHID